jgi:hypothetical protein
MKLLERVKHAFHFHKWKYYSRINNEWGIIFKLRECKCGSVEILNRRVRWEPLYKEWKFKWEKEWFDNSELLEK